jgi:U3 small nucleolar RNA-associated protein 14
MQERMTLRHKNQSKWAQRIVKRGLDAQDEGTRVAMAEQLHQHALLTRKMKTMKDSSSSDDSSDEEDSENEGGSDQDEASKLLAKARDKTMQVLEGDDEVPDSGVLSLPFMVMSAFYLLRFFKLMSFLLSPPPLLLSFQGEISMVYLKMIPFRSFASFST